MNWRKGRITVQTQTGPVEIPAMIHDDLVAYHPEVIDTRAGHETLPNHPNNTHTLTHVPSGRSIVTLSSRPEIRDFARELMEKFRHELSTINNRDEANSGRYEELADFVEARRRG
jgi:hypothetical protein